MGASSFRRSETFQVFQMKWISYRELGPHRTVEGTGEANVRHPSLALRSQVQLSSGSQEAAATRGQENAENDCQHLSCSTFPEWVIGRGIRSSYPCKNSHLPEPQSANFHTTLVLMSLLLTSGEGKFSSTFSFSNYMQAHLIGRISHTCIHTCVHMYIRHLSKGQHSTHASGTVSGHLTPNWTEAVFIWVIHNLIRGVYRLIFLGHKRPSYNLWMPYSS